MKQKDLMLIFTIAVLIIGVSLYFKIKNDQNKFSAQKPNAPIVKFRIDGQNTLIAVTGNLKYYGIIKDEEALKYALEHTKDNTPGKSGAIKVGNNTIDTEAVYDISQSMNTWEIARILLNEGTTNHDNCAQGCPGGYNPFNPALLPGGDIAPTWEEQMKTKYSWVKTFDDCVKAISSDGGQVSSAETAKRIGKPRVCNTADGRFFTEGKEGWSNQSEG